MIQPTGVKTPVPPLNLVADFGGGAFVLVIGVMAALIERAKSGQGQVVEADMVTGARYLASFPLLLSRPDIGLPMWTEPPGQNVLDGGAPCTSSLASTDADRAVYDNYVCADGRYISVGAIEPHFYALMLDKLGAALDPAFLSSHKLPLASAQSDREDWPSQRAFFTAAFASKSRDEWTRVFLGSDACVAPVLEPHEVDHLGRSAVELAEGEAAVPEQGGAPEPAPRLSRTPARSAAETYARSPPEDLLQPGRHTREVLTEAGFSAAQIDALVKGRVVEQADAEEDEEPRAKL